MKPCTSLEEASKAVVAVNELTANAPCHYLSGGWCKQSHDEDGMTCVMDWEKDGLCTDVGYTVCCEGHYSIQLWGAPGTQCTGELKPCTSALEAPEDVEAPQQPVVKKLSANAPCSFIEPDGWCKQSNDEDGMTCVMDWEEDGLCTDRGYPVCCQGRYDIQIWGKAGTEC